MSTASLQSALRAAARFLVRLDDVLNPITVKELRRTFQAKTIHAILLLLLVGSLVVMIAAVSNGEANGFASDAGREAFVVLYGALVVTCVLLVPLQVAGQLSLDRSRLADDLFRITALRPVSIIWGRLSAGLILVLVLFSVSAPFLIFTYLLRGIDLAAVFVLLVFALLVSAVVMQMFIFFACVPVSRYIGALLGLIAGGVALQAVIGLIALAAAASGGHPAGFGASPNLALWITLGILFTVLVVGLHFALSVALVSPRSANRALPVRVYISAMWILSLGGVAAWSLRMQDPAPVLIWMLIFVSLGAAALSLAVGERDALGPRVRRQIPRRGWARLVVFPFFTGNASGVTWSLITIALTILVASVWSARLVRLFHDPLGFMIMGYAEQTAVGKGIALQASAYALTAVFIKRRFFPRYRPLMAYAILGIVILMTFIAPMLKGLSSPPTYRRNRDEIGAWYVATPFGLRDEYVDHRNTTIVVAGVWAGLMFAGNLPWLVQRLRTFRPQSVWAEPGTAGAHSPIAPVARPARERSP